MNLTNEEIELIVKSVTEALSTNEEPEIKEEDRFQKWLSTLRTSFYLFKTNEEQLYAAYCQGLADGQSIQKDCSMEEVNNMLKDELFIEQVKECIENPSKEKMYDNPYVLTVGDCVTAVMSAKKECSDCGVNIDHPEFCDGKCKHRLNNLEEVNVVDMVKLLDKGSQVV